MSKLFLDKNFTIKKTFALALENHKKNNFKIAQNLYQDILKIDSDHAETHYNLGLIFQRFREIDKAKGAYQKAIQIKPKFVDAHNNLGLVFKELDDIKVNGIEHEVRKVSFEAL